MTKAPEIKALSYCRYCWRPVSEKNKRGNLVKYCTLHKTSGDSKPDYMRSHRMIDKWLSKEMALSNKDERKVVMKTDLGKRISRLSTKPTDVKFKEIKGAKALIQELLHATQKHYPDTYKQVAPLSEYIDETNLSINKVLLAIHFMLGTKNAKQGTNEVNAYDLKKSSNIWFTQLLFTIARYEAFSAIIKETSQRSTRSDKNDELRSVIKNELDMAKTRKQNQSSIAKKLNVSRQRISKIKIEINRNK